MKKKVRQADIAKRVNTSIMTVSKALNGKPGVSRELREEILRVAQEMEYTPNFSAKGLRSNSFHTIGVVGFFAAALPYAEIITSIGEVVAHKGYNMVMANNFADMTKEREAIGSILRKNIDGLIIISPTLHNKKDMEILSNFGIPTVVLLRTVQHKRIDTVGCNDFKAVYDVTSHLVERGMDKPAFIAYKKNDRHLSQIGSRRYRGYLRALKEHGIEENPECVEYGRVSIEDGYKATEALLKKGVSFNGLVCCCDEMAIGAIEALNDHGIKVPEDVCVSGYDGLAYTRYLRVPLTTVEQPFSEVGRIGAEMLFQRMENPSMPCRKIELDCKLVLRRSTEVSLTHPLILNAD